VKNSFEQLKMPEHPIGKPLGVALITLGWLYTAYILSVGRKNKMGLVLPSLAILGSVMVMKQFMTKGKMPPMAFPAIFAIAWIVLGWNVGGHLTGWMKYLGLVASALVIGSMMGLLPMQRKAGVVDGPGMPMFVLAWVIITLLNAKR
jgi:hypothetical protein